MERAELENALEDAAATLDKVTLERNRLRAQTEQLNAELVAAAAVRSENTRLQAELAAMRRDQLLRAGEDPTFVVPLELTAAKVQELFEVHAYACPMALPRTHGARVVMENFMKANHLKCSTKLNNQEKWTRVVRHCVPGEQRLADPAHYKRFPFTLFWNDKRFYKYFFARTLQFLRNDSVQFTAACLLIFLLHAWSFELYTVPLPWLGGTAACSRLPMQWHCYMLRMVQAHTFSGTEDVYKMLGVLLTKALMSMLSWASMQRLEPE